MRVWLIPVLVACGTSPSPEAPQEGGRLPGPPVTTLADGGATPLTISPQSATVVAGSTQHFTASVPVAWSVDEASCGTVDATGSYAAPSSAGTCHVVATSLADASRKARVSVIVITLSSGTMPHVSVGKPAFASEGDATLLTDGAYRDPNAWRFDPSHCTTTRPCWAAVHVGAGPSALVVDWSYQDGEGDFDTRAFGGTTLSSYLLEVSSDSTNGADGTWTQALDTFTNHPATVGDNTLIQRSHEIAFAGSSWVKLVITASTADEIDEIDLWDASQTSGDSFFFHGDSITHRCANLRGTAPVWAEQPSFQADVEAAHPGHFPLQVGGGIGTQTSADAVSEVGTYLSLFRTVRYWFFTMGTNDLCAGADAFRAHAQSWIDAVKAEGVVPILVHPIWGNDVAAYCSENGPSFNAAVDVLVALNGLRPAVPLYEATAGHPEYFEPGDVHPNPSGCAVWNQTFADAITSFYHP